MRISRKAATIVSLLALFSLAACYWGFSWNDEPMTPKESLAALRARLLLAVHRISEEDAVEIYEMFNAIEQCHGNLDQFPGNEKWADLKKEIIADGKSYMIPYLEEYSRAVRSAPEIALRETKEDDTKKVMNSVSMKVAKKMYPSLFEEETREQRIERQERVAANSIESLGVVFFCLKTDFTTEQKELMQATKQKGYCGYYFNMIKGRCGIARPCEYGQSGIHTFVYFPMDYRVYKKDFRGLDLQEKDLPATPDELTADGWICVTN